MMCLDNESLIIPTDVIRTPQQQMKFKQELRIRLNTLLTQKMVSTSGNVFQFVFSLLSWEDILYA